MTGAISIHIQESCPWPLVPAFSQLSSTHHYIKALPSPWKIYFQVVPLWFLSEARGTTGSRRRVLPQDLAILSSPKLHQGADLPDFLDHCVALGEEVDMPEVEQVCFLTLRRWATSWSTGSSAWLSSSLEISATIISTATSFISRFQTVNIDRATN